MGSNGLELYDSIRDEFEKESVRGTKKNLKKQRLYYDKTGEKNEEVFRPGDKVWVKDTLR